MLYKKVITNQKRVIDLQKPKRRQLKRNIIHLLYKRKLTNHKGKKERKKEEIQNQLENKV